MCLILWAMERICRNLYFSFSRGWGTFEPGDCRLTRGAMGVHLNSSVLQFGDFELDIRNHRLRRSGSELKLERIPMELLILLASRPGELVRERRSFKSFGGMRSTLIPKTQSIPPSGRYDKFWATTRRAPALSRRSANEGTDSGLSPYGHLYHLRRPHQPRRPSARRRSDGHCPPV